MVQYVDMKLLEKKDPLLEGLLLTYRKKAGRDRDISSPPRRGIQIRFNECAESYGGCGLCGSYGYDDAKRRPKCVYGSCGGSV